MRGSGSSGIWRMPQCPGSYWQQGGLQDNIWKKPSLIGSRSLTGNGLDDVLPGNDKFLVNGTQETLKK